MVTTENNTHRWSADGWCMTHSTDAGPVYCDSTDVGPVFCDRIVRKRPPISKEKNEHALQSH